MGDTNRSTGGVLRTNLPGVENPEMDRATPAARRIEAFRSRRSRRPLHPAEKVLLAVLGAHLCFLPWALGTMHAWSQWVSLSAGGAGLFISILPRGGSGWDAGRSALGRLARFPIFWLGLALLGYITIQALNPWMRYERNETSWWLVPAASIPWLPAGIEAPFEISDAGRQLLVFGSAWLVSCSAWAGLTRRRSWRILLALLVLNAVALAAALALQYAAGDTHLPGPLRELSDRRGLVSSFIYKNHAGAYFSLMVFVTVCLTTWGYDQGVRAMRKSTPAAALSLVSFVLSLAVLFTMSRGASLILGGTLVACAAWLGFRRVLRPSGGGTDIRVTGAIGLLFALFFLYVGSSINFSVVGDRFDRLIVDRSKEASVASRLEARQAGMALLSDFGWRGVGAGGFRWIFPAYVRRYPDIYKGGRLFWEHVHDDWLEIPIELGAAGSALISLMGAYWALLLIRCRSAWSSPVVPLLIGCLGTLVHASFDFPFQCPAILTTWCLLLTMAGRILGTEAARER
jgi:hypothetical protein